MYTFFININFNNTLFNNYYNTFFIIIRKQVGHMESTI